MKKFSFKYSINYHHEVVVEGKDEMDARELLNEDFDNGELEAWTLHSTPRIELKIGSVKPTKDEKMQNLLETEIKSREADIKMLRIRANHNRQMMMTDLKNNNKKMPTSITKQQKASSSR